MDVSQYITVCEAFGALLMRKAIKVQNFLSSREQNVFTTCAGIVWTKIKSIVLNGTQTNES